MAFYVGQKVAMVRDLDSHALRSMEIGMAEGAIYPVCGRTYTIRAIEIGGRGQDVLLLQEIDNSHVYPGHPGGEPGFAAKWFRPVVERKTSIAIFKAMLNPSDERETV